LTNRFHAKFDGFLLQKRRIKVVIMKVHAGVDKAINYQAINWWEEEEFKIHPFDVVLF